MTEHASRSVGEVARREDRFLRPRAEPGARARRSV